MLVENKVLSYVVECFFSHHARFCVTLGIAIVRVLWFPRGSKTRKDYSISHSCS